MKKVYYITETVTSLTLPTRKVIWEGTIDYLVKNVFGYTLDCGSGYNYKINKNPKTIKSLISNLTKCNDVLNRSSYRQKYYNVSTEEEMKSYKINKMHDQNYFCTAVSKGV